MTDSRRTGRVRFASLGIGLIVATSIGVVAGAQGAAQNAGPAAPAPAAARCRVDGHVTSGTASLPGASVVVHVGDVLKAATSTDIDGKYTILFTPNATYHVSAELTAFGRIERDITLAAPPCDTTVDFQLALRPRREALAAPPAQPAQNQTAPTQQAQVAPTAGGGRQNGPGQAGTGRGAAGGRGGAQGGQGAQRFQTLAVQSDANGAATLDVAPPADDSADVNRLLPTGFSVQTAQADAVAINGSSDATNLDRGALNDRLQAVNLGQFDPATGQFADGGQAFGQGGPGGPGGAGGPGGGAGRGGPGGGPGGPGGGRGGPGGGPGGRGGLVLGGRGARAQSPYQGMINYTFGGSALNSAPFQIRQDVPVTQPQFAQNTAGMTFGGPLRIPGLYKDTNRRTNFQLNYNGNRSNNLFDQYASVPTDLMRNGDFSASSIQLIDPKTGQPFAGNQIPASRIDPGAQFLLGFIPAANLPGASQNFHISTTSHTSSNSISLRVTQNLSPTVAQGGRGGPAGRGGGVGGGGRGGGGRGGAGRGTNIMLSGQLQYRRNENQSLNVFPNLGGQNTNTTITAPISLNVSRGRTVHNISLNVTHSDVEATNSFAGVQNVAGQAGINYPGTVDPTNWGVPNLSFSNFTGTRSASASSRTDDRLTAAYSWSHPIGKHQIRLGGDYRFDSSVTQSNNNARGSFTFTGVYSTGGALVAGKSGADFADFLLGVPQQATLQVGGVTRLHGKSYDAYLEDNWQKSSKLTFNLGLRYELVMPYYEISGQMANLDAAGGFTNVAPVLPGATGPLTGVSYPTSLINADINNIGPRIGFAYRFAQGTILRGGYSLTYNPGSYAAIARQLVAQPPFAETETVVGASGAPLSLENALLSSTSRTTNNYGVDRDYALGTIHTYNATVSRNLTPVWSVVIGYTGVKGTDLDLLSAPNRGPSGLLIPTVQPFTWESSGARSMLNSANVQLTRRLAHGISGSASYTLARSMDNTPSLGGGNAVAQDPHNLDAEWALSNFNRYHQFSANLLLEIPFGANRRWLADGGLLAAIFGNWSATMAFTAASGNPLTARVVGAASSVAQGVNGALRADYTGGSIQESDPTLAEFFNTSAFAVPARGLFGDAGRNMIIGPRSHQLNGSFTRDIRLGGNRAVTLQVNANNLLNTVQWASVDANINSSTFGQVLSARPMRSMTLNARFRF